MPTDSRIETADAPSPRCVSLQVGVSGLLQDQLDRWSSNDARRE
jgi:hypothetical protein